MRWLHSDLPSAEPPAPSGIVRQPIRFAEDVEASRDEYFIRATAPGYEDQRLAAHNARIVSPADGTLIATDPEILDGHHFGDGGEAALWLPQPGAHELSLVDSSGRTIDRVAFRVRGRTSLQP